TRCPGEVPACSPSRGHECEPMWVGGVPPGWPARPAWHAQCWPGRLVPVAGGLRGRPRVTGRVARPVLVGRLDEEEFMPQHKGRRWISGKAIVIGGCASLLGGLALAGPATPGVAATTAGAGRHATPATGCQFGNGIKHV